MCEEILAKITDRLAAVRAALIERYEWFTHGTHVDRFDNIKERGILLSDPRTREQTNRSPRHVVCLQPFPKRRFLPLPGPAFKLALHRDALPARIGVDLSF